LTAAAFEALTALAGKVLQRNFPNFTFVLILSDDQFENVATNCAAGNQEILDMMDRAIEQVIEEGNANPAPPAVVDEVKA